MSLRALLLSRDQECIRILSDVLNKLNVAVENCSEPFIAAKLLMDQKFDCVIVDCDDQQGSGWVLQSARLAPANRNSLTIALLSATPKPGSFKMGENFIINKPITAKQAESTLRIACSLMNSAASATTVSSGEPAVLQSNENFEDLSSSLAPQMAATDVASSGIPTLNAQAVSQFSAPTFSTDSLEDVLEASEPDIKPAPPVTVGRTGAAAAPARAPIAQASSSSLRTTQPTVPARTVARPVAQSPLESPDEIMTDLRELAGPAVASIAATQTTHHRLPPQGALSEAHRIQPQYQPGHESGSGSALPRWAVGVLTITLLLGAVAYGWWHLHATAARTQVQDSQPAAVPQQMPVQPNAAVTNLPAEQQAAIPAPSPKAVVTEPHKVAEAHTKPPIAPVPEPIQVTTNLEPLPPAPKLAQAQPEEPIVPPTLTAVAGSANASAVGIMNSLPSAKPTLTPAKRIVVSQGISQGLLLQRVNPSYPAVARQAHISGDVLLQAVIGKDGSIQHLKVLHGQPLLVQSALTAVKQWRYRPYLLNGNPVEIETQIMVQFKN